MVVATPSTFVSAQLLTQQASSRLRKKVVIERELDVVFSSPTPVPTTSSRPSISTAPSTSSQPSTSTQPSSDPSIQPSLSSAPSSHPSSKPTLRPTQQPTPLPSPAPTSPPTPQPTQPPTPFPTSTVSNCGSCSPNLGLQYVAAGGCVGFYHCLYGERSSYQACPEGTLFDSNSMTCDYTGRVTCNCFGSAPPGPQNDPNPTPPPTVSVPPPPPSPPPTRGPRVSICESCAQNNGGLVAADDCEGFYYCMDGYRSNYQPCPTGLRYDSTIKGCDHPSSFICECTSEPPSEPPPIDAEQGQEPDQAILEQEQEPI
ncbi:hypothetical protein ACHAWC_006643 [Mediolabrus comicus]